MTAMTANLINVLNHALSNVSAAAELRSLIENGLPSTSQVVNLDIGSSGVVGSLDLYPATAAKGKLAMSVTDQVGDTTVSMVIGAMAAARTLTVPDPLASTNFLMGRQAALAITANADGLTTAIIPDYGRLQHVTVTSGNAGHFVTLPTPTPGTMLVIDVVATGYKLRSSTPASIAINGGTGASASSTIAANSTILAICISATAWKAIFLDADADVAKVAAAA